MGFKLTVVEGSEKGRDFSFDRIQVTIGRTMDNDVVLTDPGISRQHLSIRNKGGAYIVKDLGSSNGTEVNGNKILEEVLRAGDVIMAGGAKIRFDGASGDGASKPKPAARSSRPARGAARARSNSKRAAAARSRARNKAGGAKPRRGASGGKKPEPSEPKLRSAGIRQRKAPAGEATNAKARKTARNKNRGKQAPGGKVGGLTKFKMWFGGLEKKKKIILLSVVGLVLLLALFGLFKGGQKIVQGAKWYDDEMLTPGKMVDNKAASYGLGIARFDCLYRATFQFRYANGRSTMVYRVGAVNNKHEIDILLNGMHVGYAPITLDNYSSRLVLNLPRKHLLENDLNKLQFVNTINRADENAQDTWAVVVYEISEQPLPPPDRKKAQEAFVNANERLRNKGVAPGNLYKALEFMKQTRDYLELLPEDGRPEIYEEANDRISKIETELDKIFSDHVFKAEKAMKFSGKAEAKEIYRLLMLTFPNKDDHRNQKARKEYIALGGSLQDI